MCIGLEVSGNGIHISSTPAENEVAEMITEDVPVSEENVTVPADQRDGVKNEYVSALDERMAVLTEQIAALTNQLG